MGVRVVVDDEEEECSSSYTDYSVVSSASCYACGAKTSSNTNYSHINNSSSNNGNNVGTNNKNKSSSSSSDKCTSQAKTTEFYGHATQADILGPHNYSRACKDIVGNCKEFRIEHNKYDLRIIGNGNRVRIGENVGNLQIIGNSTRLKINSNSGHIKYTGNDGRICLGSDSSQQLVDYIGCNGILKIINAMELCTLRGKCHQKSKTKCSTKRDSGVKMANGSVKNKTSTGTAAAATTVTFDGATRLNIPKSASYGGHDGRDKEWPQFASQFQRQSANWCNISNVTNTSMPNLKENYTRHCKCNCKCRQNSTKANNENCRMNSHINVINNIGNIVIKNAINVSI